MALAPENRERLEAARDEALAIRDEAKHVGRRARLLTQQAAQLEGIVAEIVESEEDTTDARDEST